MKNVKNLKDYTVFKLEKEDILWEARMRCMKEMYAKAQPSVDYDEIYSYYKKCKEEGKEPERIYNRYYLSQEEFTYIRQKYVDAYMMHNPFREDCDLIIDNMEKGTIRNKWIPEHTDKYGTHPGYRGYEDVPSLKEIIGEENANKVIEYIKDRRDFYRYNTDEEKFTFSVTLSDSPTSNAEEVIEYWKSQGRELKIDPRHYDDNYFWCEENGYLEEDE